MDDVQDVLDLVDVLLLFEQEQESACHLAYQSWGVILQMAYDAPSISDLEKALQREMLDASPVTTWGTCLNKALNHVERSAAACPAHA